MPVTDVLRSASITPLDAELLLAHILEKDRAWLLAHGKTALTEEQKKRYDDLIKRRKNHEPIAYILGEKEFYGRSFSVDRRVLIPRPSTEALIDEVKFLFENDFHIESPRMIEADTDIVILTHLFPRKGMCFDTRRQAGATPASALASVCRRHDTAILDIGTGSGCIAITLAKEIPDVKIIATDISDDALEVAKINAENHGVLDRIEFVEADGIPSQLSNFQTSKPQNLKTSPFLLISNPPYIPDHDQLPPDVSLYEPHTALIAGPDGMDVLTPLIQAAKEHPSCMGFVVEMMQSQCTRHLGTLHE